MRFAPACLLLAACSREPAGSSPPPAASEPATAEPLPTLDPQAPSYKCGSIRCNVDYYCVQRKKGDPSEVCTAHPPSAKREGCMKVASRTFVCESFP